MEASFVLLLVGALVLNTLLTLWQSKAYTNQINEIVRAHAGTGLRLVSGRGKGRIRGAVVVLLVNPQSREIVEARAMVGASVFSRLKPAPYLCGSLSGAQDRVEGKRLKQAVEAAVDMLPAIESRNPSQGVRVGRTKVRVPAPSARG